MGAERERNAGGLDLKKVRAVAPEPTDSFELGTEWNGYRILAVLGRGGMGEVYLALETFLDRYVALKVAPIKSETDPVTQDRLRREAAAGVRIEHDNVVRVLSGGMSSGKVFLAMEYLQGGKTGRDLIAMGPLKPDIAVTFAIQLADGLKGIHAAGIHHRDLKPENFIVIPGGRVKIIDFGLARVRSQTLKTTRPMKMGTPHYMAPEQFDDTLGLVDSRVDVYALGLITIEMIMGRHVFELTRSERLNKHEVTMAHVLTEPPKLSEIRPDLPPKLAGLVERMLQKRPSARPTADDVGRVLREVAVEIHRDRLPHMTTEPTPSGPQLRAAFKPPSASAPPSRPPPVVLSGGTTSRGTQRMIDPSTGGGYPSGGSGVRAASGTERMAPMEAMLPGSGASGGPSALSHGAAALEPSRVASVSAPAPHPADAFLPDVDEWAARAANDLETDRKLATSGPIRADISHITDPLARTRSALLGVGAALAVCAVILLAFWVGRRTIEPPSSGAAADAGTAGAAAAQSAGPAPSALSAAATSAAGAESRASASASSAGDPGAGGPKVPGRPPTAAPSPTSTPTLAPTASAPPTQSAVAPATPSAPPPPPGDNVPFFDSGRQP